MSELDSHVLFHPHVKLLSFQPYGFLHWCELMLCCSHLCIMILQYSFKWLTCKNIQWLQHTCQSSRDKNLIYISALEGLFHFFCCMTQYLPDCLHPLIQWGFVCLVAWECGRKRKLWKLRWHLEWVMLLTLTWINYAPQFFVALFFRKNKSGRNIWENTVLVALLFIICNLHMKSHICATC
jgi:hypothetical protein